MKFLETLSHQPHYLPANARVCIYGTGSGGRHIKELVERYREDIRISFWVDSFDSGELEGLKIIKADELANFKDQFDWVLVASTYWEEIVNKLKQLEISNYMVVSPQLFQLNRKEDLLAGPQALTDMRRELDVLYSVFYQLTQDKEDALDFFSHQTRQSFAHQWEHLKDGQYLLTDPWFKENVDRILWEEEIQIKPSWFKGKHILDVGCGNGRWSYGFAKLGANITAVDVNQNAIAETRAALQPFNVEKQFYVCPVEELSTHLPSDKYDLVFSWGVLHHCKRFNRALQETLSFVKDDGMLYLYLYGWESTNPQEEMDFFKERLHYNTLMDEEEKYRFLLKKAGGNPNRVHNYHDSHSPIVRRRLRFDEIEQVLMKARFRDIVRTIQHTELFIRAIKSNKEHYYRQWLLPPKSPPYWFQHHQRKQSQ
ncbi:MAG: class I SAM-dependent methyltransferase [bacterium]|nr:class I SAM-dependent methyltransferase [bacterium]